MKFKRLTSWILCVSLAVIVAGCGGGDSDGVVGTGFGDPADSVKPFTISGAAQKGPFIKGTRVLINRLTSLAEGTYETTVGEIDDNLGNFRFAYKGTGPVLIEADGVHFNEVTGQLSNSQLRLRAIYNVNSNPEQHAYINVLTHLAYGRIQKLIRSGTPIDDAIKQGELAVIESLQPVLPVANVVDFTELSLFNTDQSRAISNAYLLALSATVAQYAIEKQKTSQGSPVESELTYLLDNLSYSIAEVGRIDGVEVISNLKQAAKLLRPDQIRESLIRRSSEVLHMALPVADIDLFIDTDGDGVVNSEDTDDDNDGIPDASDSTPYVFTTVLSLSKPSNPSAIPSVQAVAFEWLGAEVNKEIEMQIAADPLFTRSLSYYRSASPVVSTRFPLAGHYYVKSRAQNLLGTWGSWSETVPITVGSFDSTINTTDYYADKDKYFSDLTPTSDGGVIVNSGEFDPNTGQTQSQLTKLDGLGNAVWKKSNAGGLHEKGLELIDGSILMPRQFDQATGKQEYVVLDRDGINNRVLSAYLGDFDSLSLTKAVVLNNAIFFVYMGTYCVPGGVWFQCLPIAHPTLVRLDPISGQATFTKVSDFGDLSQGEPMYASGPIKSSVPRLVPQLDLAEKTAPWDRVLTLNTTEDGEFLLTFSTRFEANCTKTLCYRTGAAKFDTKGTISSLWFSHLLSDAPPATFVGKSSTGILLTEVLLDGNDQSQTRSGYFFSSGDLSPVSYRNLAEFGRETLPVVTNDGRLFILSIDEDRNLLKVDLVAKTKTKILIPCDAGKRCELITFCWTPDASLILNINVYDYDGFTESFKIAKLIGADI